MAKPTLWMLRDVEIFYAGVHHQGTPWEREWTFDDLDKIVANFNLAYFHKPDPLYQPPLKIGHEPDQGVALRMQRSDWPAAGWIKRLWRNNELLFADMGEVPDEVATWIAERKYRTVSCEILDDPPPAITEAGGSGPFLEAVSMLGAAAPEVRGLKDLPMPVMLFTKQLRRAGLRISHRRRSAKRTFYFSEVTMDRAQMLDWLAQRGVDIAVITDVVPDNVIAELVRVLEAAEKQVADAGGGGGSDNRSTPATPVAGAAGVSDGRQPSQVTLKFSDIPGASELIETVKTLSTQFASQKQVIDASQRTQEQQREKDKQTLVHQFCKRMVGENKLTPAEVEVDAQGNPHPDTVIALLLACDHNRVHTFASGGKTIQRTQLEQAMAVIEKRQPHTFSKEKMAVGGAGAGGMLDKIREEVTNKYKGKTARSGERRSIAQVFGLRGSRGYR